MKTMFDRNGNNDSLIRVVHHYTIEDHETDKGLECGVSVQFEVWAGTPAMIVTPFTRGMFPNRLVTMNSDAAFTYNPKSLNPIMSALAEGELRGRYEADTVMGLLHEHVPAEWAEKWLPEIYARLQKLHLNWDYTKQE